jgi:hypothetical protein
MQDQSRSEQFPAGGGIAWVIHIAAAVGTAIAGFPCAECRMASGWRLKARKLMTAADRQPERYAGQEQQDRRKATSLRALMNLNYQGEGQQNPPPTVQNPAQDPIRQPQLERWMRNVQQSPSVGTSASNARSNVSDTSGAPSMIECAQNPPDRPQPRKGGGWRWVLGPLALYVAFKLILIIGQQSSMHHH